MRTIGFAVVPLLLIGCANLNSIHHDLDTSQGRGAMVDVKQRAIIVSKNTYDTRICAEPSPDAMSSYALQLAAEGKAPTKEALELAFNQKEGSAFVGLRTQSIQVLRDQMYRICEAYLSHGISSGEYELLMRRSQRVMVALLAIEQLTGVMRRPQPMSFMSASAGIQGDTVLKKKIAALKAKAEASEGTAKEVLEAVIKDMESDAEASPSPGDSQTPTSAANPLGPEYASQIFQIEASLMHSIAATVENVVKSVVLSDDTPHLCFSHLKEVSVKALEEQKDAMAAICAEYFSNQFSARSRLKPQPQAYDYETAPATAFPRGSNQDD
jgi:hypothetical protein